MAAEFCSMRSCGMCGRCDSHDGLCQECGQPSETRFCAVCDAEEAAAKDYAAQTHETPSILTEEDFA